MKKEEFQNNKTGRNNKQNNKPFQFDLKYQPTDRKQQKNHNNE
jgi:hypothetical protein